MYPFYQKIYSRNVYLKTPKTYFYIHTGSGFEEVIHDLAKQNILKDTSGFRWLSEGKMKYSTQVKPGRYTITDGMNNLDLIRLLRSGEQEEVKLTIQLIRFKRELAGIVSHKLEIDSVELLQCLNDNDFLHEFGVNEENVMGLFVANTYQFKWNTTPKQFMRKMKTEFDKAWTSSRKQLAEKLDLQPMEVATLASIVQEEIVKKDEAQKVAGVYVNRVHKGMLLQSDPTVKYVIFIQHPDTVIRRLFHPDRYESPYNTYTHKGLPPAPIVTPYLWAIDAVLNHEKHNFLFFVAKFDGSGYHKFAMTREEHERNAREYHDKLNEANIHH